MSCVLFQGWDSGTLGNTLIRCVTQDPRVARCLKRLLLSSPLTLMCACVCGCGHTCAYKKLTFRLHHARGYMEKQEMEMKRKLEMEIWNGS